MGLYLDSLYTEILLRQHLDGFIKGGAYVWKGRGTYIRHFTVMKHALNLQSWKLYNTKKLS